VQAEKIMPEEADPRIANVGSGAAATQGGVAAGAGGVGVGGNVSGGIVVGDGNIIHAHLSEGEKPKTSPPDTISGVVKA
jgi:hypothetical protein